MGLQTPKQRLLEPLAKRLKSNELLLLVDSILKHLTALCLSSTLTPDEECRPQDVSLLFA